MKDKEKKDTIVVPEDNAIISFTESSPLGYIQNLDFDEEDVRNRFKLLTDLAYFHSVDFSESNRKTIRSIRKAIRTLKGMTSIKIAKDNGYKPRSVGYEAIKNILSQINDFLDMLFDVLYERILTVENARKELDRLKNTKLEIIQAIGDAGGDNTISASNTEIGEMLSDINKQSNYYHEIVRDPDFQPKRDPLARNIKKNKDQEVS